ncbi:hypothetical protein [Streptomyces sp. NBC_01483]|uniref:hypothetical protein n=1 Tax=Streptomyces sp. NBC_01483 TaxID=2903883 RepID=UPI002E2F102A|nr:hypothetical protein [Streptomyces sp. NBC_01483]
MRCLPADRYREPRGQALAGPAGQGHSTLLALVMALPDPFAATPRVLGLDEFALRKEHNSYGTVLVDCETRAPVVPTARAGGSHLRRLAHRAPRRGDHLP